MTRRFLYASITIAGVLCALAMGCGDNPASPQGGSQSTLYIEGFLKAGGPVDSVFVGVTTPLSETVSRSESGVTGAAVTLEVDGTTSALQALVGRPGYYSLSTLRVASGKTYQLTVKTGERTAQAQTTVPSPPTASASSTEMKVGDNPITVTWKDASDNNHGFLSTVAAQALGPSIPLETLFGGFFGGRFPGFSGIDTTGFAAQRDSLSIRDRWQYQQGYSTTLNWRQFSHYGTYAFRVYVIDRNYADFLVSSRQDPQTLDEPRFHVSGGIGIFASMAADSVVFKVSE